jgi:hypothetical protein
VTEQPEDRLDEVGAAERRGMADRRSHLERAAALATQALDLRALCDAEARQVTTIAKHIELLRTPTAPAVQRQIALEQLTRSAEQLAILGERIRAEAAALNGRIQREVATLEQSTSGAPSTAV